MVQFLTNYTFFALWGLIDIFTFFSSTRKLYARVTSQEKEDEDEE